MRKNIFLMCYSLLFYAYVCANDISEIRINKSKLEKQIKKNVETEIKSEVILLSEKKLLNKIINDEVLIHNTRIVKGERVMYLPTFKLLNKEGFLASNTQKYRRIFLTVIGTYFFSVKHKEIYGKLTVEQEVVKKLLKTLLEEELKKCEYVKIKGLGTYVGDEVNYLGIEPEITEKYLEVLHNNIMKLNKYKNIKFEGGLKE